jgi:hypothetical protein
MNQKLKDVLILPNSLEEKNYCIKYGIQLRRLINGITIVGIPSETEGGVFASISWRFPSGSYKNPAGQVHFFEHFFNKKLRDLATWNNVNVSASTSILELSEEAKGIANPEVSDFGIWKILKPIRESLEQPIDDTTNIEGEKDVIKDEIRTQKADHYYYVDRLWRDVLYSKDNPYYNSPPVAGNEEDVENITKTSLKKLMNKILIPDGLLIRVYTEGKKENATILCNEIENLFLDFPRIKSKHKKFNRALLDKMNLDFKPGKIYLKNTGLKNKKVTTDFVWILKTNYPDVAHFALARLDDLIYLKVHEESRLKGWGYYTNVYRTTPAEKLTIFTIRVDRHNENDPEKFAKEVLLPSIKNSILKGISKKTIEEFCSLEVKKQIAIPIRPYDRLDRAMSGLEDYGAMLNADKLKLIYKNIKPKHFEDWLTELSNTEPAILITGDLN